MHSGEEVRLFVIQDVVHLAGKRKEALPHAVNRQSLKYIICCLCSFGGVQFGRGLTVSPDTLHLCQRVMRSNAWTTVEELNFLEALIPQFVSQQEVRVVGPWLAEKATAFFAKFPLRSAEFDRDRLTKVCFSLMGSSRSLTHSVIETTDVVWEPHPRPYQRNGRSSRSRPLRQGQPPTTPPTTVSSILRALLPSRLSHIHGDQEPLRAIQGW